MQTLEKNGCVMKNKIIDKTEWARIFKVLPVSTADGYRVCFEYVWVRNVDGIWEDEKEYHTNPDGLEDLYQSHTAIGIPPMRNNCRQSLTEGGMLHGRKPMHQVKRPKAPPRPPRPKGTNRPADKTGSMGPR